MFSVPPLMVKILPPARVMLCPFRQMFSVVPGATVMPLPRSTSVSRQKLPCAGSAPELVHSVQTTSPPCSVQPTSPQTLCLWLPDASGIFSPVPPRGPAMNISAVLDSDPPPSVLSYTSVAPSSVSAARAAYKPPPYSPAVLSWIEPPSRIAVQLDWMNRPPPFASAWLPAISPPYISNVLSPTSAIAPPLPFLPFASFFA